MLTPNYFFIFAVSQPSQILWSLWSWKRTTCLLRPWKTCDLGLVTTACPLHYDKSREAVKRPLGSHMVSRTVLSMAELTGGALRSPFAKPHVHPAQWTWKRPVGAVSQVAVPELQGVGLALRQWATFCRERAGKTVSQSKVWVTDVSARGHRVCPMAPFNPVLLCCLSRPPCLAFSLSLFVSL